MIEYEGWGRIRGTEENFKEEQTTRYCRLYSGRDRHPREALRATVRALLGVAAQTSDQRQVQVELLDEPLHARARLVAHHLPRSQGTAALTIEAETITNVQLFEDEFRSRFASR